MKEGTYEQEAILQFRNVIVTDSVEHHSYQCVTEGLVEDYHGYRQVISILPKGETRCISYKIGRRIIGMLLKGVIGNNVKVHFKSSSAEGPPSYKIAPTVDAQHQMVINSTTYEQRRFFEPVVKAFGTNPGPLPVPLQKLLVLQPFHYTNAFDSWKQAERVDIQVITRTDFYDLRGTDFVKQEFRKAWVAERTITRQMAQELEQRISGPMRRFKGVRWRPERKHPWVAEIKLPKRKKMWIGNYDTQEEAARAFDVAAVFHNHQTTLNFQDSLLVASQTILASPFFGLEQCIEDVSLESAHHT